MAELSKEVRNYYEKVMFGSALDKDGKPIRPPEHLELLWSLEESGAMLWSGGWDNQPYINERALNICRNLREELRRVKEMQDEVRRASPAASTVGRNNQWRFSL